MITWTLKIDEELDKKTAVLLKELGYTSKAELIRELLRQKLIELQLINYDIDSVDRHINAKMELEDALAELKKLSLETKTVEEIVKKSRDEMEGILFSEKEAGT